MARKSKTTKRKTAKRKTVQKTSRPKRTLAKTESKVKPRRQAGRQREEPSSGSASSSLDPRRAGRLQLRDSRTSGRRERIGDLQGISMDERADSESVGELLDEGQTFEAEAVRAIEDAPDADQGEIHTREVPEDDVPEEYHDKE